jgi:hypothetical protein
VAIEFLFRTDHSLRAEGGTCVVADEQGLEFADDFLGSGFRVSPLHFLILIAVLVAATLGAMAWWRC